jgi:hypothetical protein
MPLMTTADLPADLAGRSDSQRLLDAAITLAERFCRRPFFYAEEIVETFDGMGGPSIFLKAVPIAAVTSVSVDGYEITDFEFNAATGRLWRGEGHCHPDNAPYFPFGHENIAVEYDGGYDTGECPGDLKYAIAEGVRGLGREQGRDGTLKSEMFSGDYSWTAADKPGEFDIFSSSAKSILRKYRTSGNHVIG